METEKNITLFDVEEFREKRVETYIKEKGKGAYNQRIMVIGGISLLAIGGSIALLVIFIVSIVRRNFPFQVVPIGERHRPSFGIIACIKFIVVVIFLMILFSFFAYGLSRADSGQDSRVLNMVAVGISELAAVGIFLVILVFEYGFKFREMGLTGLKRLVRGIRSGLLGYYAFMALIFGFIFCWAFFSKAAGIEEKANPVLGPLLESPGPGLIIATVFMVCIVAPIVEEFLFRGLLYSALRERFGIMVAVPASSVLFGIMHAGLYNWVPTMVLGLAFAFIYERSRCLYASMAAHAAHNSVVMVMFFFLY